MMYVSFVWQNFILGMHSHLFKRGEYFHRFLKKLALAELLG